MAEDTRAYGKGGMWDNDNLSRYNPASTQLADFASPDGLGQVLDTATHANALGSIAGTMVGLFGSTVGGLLSKVGGYFNEPSAVAGLFNDNQKASHGQSKDIGVNSMVTDYVGKNDFTPNSMEDFMRGIHPDQNKAYNDLDQIDASIKSGTLNFFDEMLIAQSFDPKHNPSWKGPDYNTYKSMLLDEVEWDKTHLQPENPFSPKNLVNKQQQIQQQVIAEKEKARQAAAAKVAAQLKAQAQAQSRARGAVPSWGGSYAGHANTSTGDGGGGQSYSGPSGNGGGWDAGYT